MHSLGSGNAKKAIEIMEVEGREVPMKAIAEVITVEAEGTIIMARETTPGKAAARMATTALPHRNQAMWGEIKAHPAAI